MTSHELARLLLDGPDLPAHLAFPANDYWRTTLAPPVGRVETETVAPSDYHRCPTLIDEGDAQAVRVIVIRS